MRRAARAALLPALGAALLLVSCSGGQKQAPKEAGPGAKVLAIRDARVFDGEEVIPRATVLVRDGVITALGADVPVPRGAQIFHGSGKTLLPGLIDAHAHIFGEEAALEQALVFGVTTELDMMGDPEVARRLRSEAGEAGARGRAAIFSSGWAVTVPGGHGPGEGYELPTLKEDADPAAFVAERVAEGSDYIKIIYEHGALWGVDVPTLSPQQLEATVRAAHDEDKLAVTHVTTGEEAAAAIAAGSDGLAHIYIDGPSPKLAQEIAKAGAFVVPTLAVLFSVCDGTRGLALAEDDAVAPYLAPSSERALRQSYRLVSPGLPCAQLLASTRELLGQGVPLLAGTDAGNAGTTHGATLHDELALLVEAGMTPGQALAAATSATAEAFGLEKRGRIRPGYRADLLLVEGDPTRDIGQTRRIVAVWKAGVKLDRERYRSKVAGGPRLAEPIAPGSLGDFEEEAGGWIPSSDRTSGGASEATLELTGGGAVESSGALSVFGSIRRKGDAPPWAGAMRFVGREPPEPSDLSAVETLRFWTRGDGADYRVLIFTVRKGAAPIELHSFSTTEDWARHEVSLTPLSATARREVVSIVFAAGPRPGSFRFELDAVELE